MKIDFNRIHPSALFIIKQLKHNGFEAYLVGGAVRDLLIDKEPKDFDIVTSATNSQIAGLFEICELIGRRFPIALVRINKEIFEVSTFVTEEEDQSLSVIRKREKGEDRIPGTMLADSSRRDFTVNGLYYCPAEDKVFDREGGLDDLMQRQLRFIGNAEAKILEDPVRIIRGIRLSFQIGLNISEELNTLFQKYAFRIDESSKSRLIEEIGKILGCGHSHEIFLKLIKLGVFSKSFPHFYKFLTEEFARVDGLNLLTVLKEVDRIVIQYGKMRESSLFGVLCLPFITREYGLIWESNPPSIELVERLKVKFSEIWIEIALKKWAKQKVIDMYLTQWRFVFPKDKIFKSNIIFKEYFLDSFRLFRFYSNLTGLYPDYLNFWGIARKHPELLNELLDAFSKGENLNDEKFLTNAIKKSPKRSRWKSYHARKKKKG